MYCLLLILQYLKYLTCSTVVTMYVLLEMLISNVIGACTNLIVVKGICLCYCVLSRDIIHVTSYMLCNLDYYNISDDSVMMIHHPYVDICIDTITNT